MTIPLTPKQIKARLDWIGEYWELWKIPPEHTPKNMNDDTKERRSQPECSGCHGDKQVWDADTRMMQDCTRCRGTGKSLFITFPRWDPWGAIQSCDLDTHAFQVQFPALGAIRPEDEDE